MNEPTSIERKYLRYLIDKTGTGPRLPIGSLTSAGMRAWINALEPIALAMDAIEDFASVRSQRRYLVTPRREQLPESYVPPYVTLPEAFDHQHSIDTYTTQDDIEVVYCTRCGAAW